MARWMTVTAMVMFFMPQIVSAQHQPCSGLQERPVKTLSDQQVADLGAGRGMGLALAAETDLDRQLASKVVTEASPVEGGDAVAAVQAALRAAHLIYHLATVEVLTPKQVTCYGELPSYAGGSASASVKTGSLRLDDLSG